MAISENDIKYQPNRIEEKWYTHWENRSYFSSKPDERQAYTIVIPPPNITGVLHMGHMLNNTIQDLLIRRARLQGKNACWVPGTDHASIATEAKVVRMLREKGIKKSDLSREEFLKYSFEWKEKYGGIILQQLRKLGASCDWDRTAFTMDEARSKQVIRSFVDLYNKGKLYRGKRMINWDPDAKTVLSNEEVIYYEENAQLFYLFYKLEGSNEGITIATQRPETIMADVAVAVHPGDPRYQHMHGRKVIIPLINRAIPIVCDDYVDPEFGTGALKITPAHDQNDYEIGLKHKLPIIDILNEHRRAGKILAFGGSNWSHQRIEAANAYALANGLELFVASSPQYGLAEALGEPWPLCLSISGSTASKAREWYVENQLPVLAWSPLASGFFSGRFTRDNLHTFGDREWDRVCVSTYASEPNFQRLDRATALGSEKGLTAAQIALAFALNQPMNIFAVVGSTNIDTFKHKT